MEENPKQMVTYGKKESKQLLYDIKKFFPELYKLYLANNIKYTKEFLEGLNNYFKSEKHYLNDTQKDFFAIVMIDIISKYNNNNKPIINIKEYEAISEGKKDLNKFIFDIINNLIVEMFTNKNYLKAKKDWDEKDIYLEDIEIDESLREQLDKKINGEMKNYYKDLDIKNEPKILKKIYGCLLYENRKIEYQNINKTLKEYGDEERKKDDYGRDLPSNEEKPNGQSLTDEIDKRKITDEEIKEIFKYFEIQITLEQNEEDCNISYDYYSGDPNPKEKKTCYTNAQTQELYNDNNKNERNYKRYLIFIEQVQNHLKFLRKQKEIKINAKIKMLLIITNNSQKETVDLYDVKCISSLECLKNKEKKYEAIDKEILVHGIHGKIPGFIFLAEELSNEDNEINENKNKK